ncbi:hypothetical protein PG990_001601 [Apiospora arundinis]|uniref:Uncharacterized protein n=1 Tax=Apiospora arundinis TaxID=335852 RepID=A0ABR2HS33_9PEZI
MTTHPSEMAHSDDRKQRSRLEDVCIRYCPVLEGILAHLSGSDAAVLLAVVGLFDEPDWAGIQARFVQLQRDIPEHSNWIDQMVLHGHKVLLVGSDLDSWLARLRDPLRCRRHSTLRVWLAVRVRYGVDREFNTRRQANEMAHFIVTKEGDVIWGPSRASRRAKENIGWTENNVIPLPHGAAYKEPLLPQVLWRRTDIPNENGIELVWAQTATTGRLPVIDMCPTQWRDQGQDQGQEGWHRVTLAWTAECDRIAPGAVYRESSYGGSIFRLPYLDLSTSQYSETVHLQEITQPERLAFVVILECAYGPTDVMNKLQGIFW